MALNSIYRFFSLALCSALIFNKILDREQEHVNSLMSLKQVMVDVKYAEIYFKGKWFSGNELLLANAFITPDLVLLNVDSRLPPHIGRRRLTELNWKDTSIEPEFYSLSQDRKFALLQYQTEKDRYSGPTAEFTVININDAKRSFTLAFDGNSRLQNVRFVGSEHAVVIMFNNDVYYKEDVSQLSTKQITNDGVPGEVYNGHEYYCGDVLTPEENFAIRSTKDGKKLSYLKLDVAELRNVTIPKYTDRNQNVFRYPKIIQHPYPYAGGKAAKETLHIINIDDNFEQFQVPYPADLQDPILIRHVWANNDVLNAIWMNRLQNEMYILAYDVKKRNTVQIVHHRRETNGWIDFPDTPIFCQDGSMFLLILPREQNANNGAYKHLVLIENKENGIVHELTEGKYVVTEIFGWKEPENLIYYEASREDHPEQRHIYSITYPKKEITCLSCNLKSVMSNTDCLFNSAKFSTDSSHSVIECRGPGIPTIFFFKGEKQIYVWQKNKELAKTLESIRTPIDETYTFDTFDGCKAHVLLKFPSNVDTSGNIQYPMLVKVFTVQSEQRVTKQFKLDVDSYLAESKNIITASIDGRSTGMESNKCLLSIYKRLGTVEIAEIDLVTRKLIEKFPYIDPKRTAVWGYSMGGYAAGMALATGSTFKCGISLAAVSDWRLHQTISAEQFLGLPTVDDNLEGYEAASLLLKADGIRGKSYLLIHGSLDDQVQYAHAALLAKVLQQKDISFTQLSCPDRNHFLRYNYYVTQTVVSFLDKCFTEE